MAEQQSRLPIKRGLVAERKARLQKIKDNNDSPRRPNNILQTETRYTNSHAVFSTPEFGTPTTVRSSPRRSRNSMLGSYVSNGSLKDMLRRKQSAVTIAGQYAPKSQAHRTFFRKPTPYAQRKSQALSSDTDSQDQQLSKNSEVELRIHHPMPQSQRLSLANCLESRVDDVLPDLSVRTSFDHSSQSPSSLDFARVLSHAAVKADEYPPEKPYRIDETVLKADGSQDTIRPPSITPTVATTVTLAAGKRASLRKIFKGRSRTENDTESQLSVTKDKSRIRRVFSSKQTRVPSDERTSTSSSNDDGLKIEYSSSRVVVRTCKLGHEILEMLDGQGGMLFTLKVAGSEACSMCKGQTL